MFSKKNLILVASIALAVGLGVKLAPWIPLPQPGQKS